VSGGAVDNFLTFNSFGKVAYVFEWKIHTNIF